MAEDQGVTQIHCATYTHARRHPMVLGRIAGWTPPFQLSLTQIGVLLVSFYVMVQTWRMWSGVLPSTLDLVVGAGVPIGLTWAVRRVKVEGRSLPRAALGWVMLWSVPPKGTVRGRPHREPRPVALAPVRVNVTPAPAARPASGPTGASGSARSPAGGPTDGPRMREGFAPRLPRREWAQDTLRQAERGRRRAARRGTRGQSTGLAGAGPASRRVVARGGLARAARRGGRDGAGVS